MKVKIMNKLGSALLGLLLMLVFACGSDSYLIKVVISGLEGTLVLQNNASDELTITQNGTYNFAVKIKKDGAFNVMVTGEPLAQNCAVSGGKGTVEGSGVLVNIQCSGRSWHHPPTLRDHISVSSYDGVQDEPKVAMDGSGNAIVVWCQGLGSFSNYDYGIFKSEYRDRKWTHPASLADFISPPGNSCNGKVSVAMDNAGNAIIVWQQHDGTHNHIYKSEYRDHNGDGVWQWEHPYSLGDYINPDMPSETDAENPTVAMDNSGNAIIVWRQYNGGRLHVFNSEYRNGLWVHPAETTEYIDADTPSEQHAGTPVLAMSDNGTAIISWIQNDSSLDFQVFISDYGITTAGGWTHPSTLDDNISPDGEDAYEPSVAMDGSGNAIVVWRQYDGSYNNIYKSEYRGSWVHPAGLAAFIDPNKDSTGGPNPTNSYEPRVAMDNNGNAVIVWRQYGGGNDRIFMSEYRDGAWTHPANTSLGISPQFSDAESPRVAMDNNGQAIVVWMQENDNGYENEFMSEYRNGAWTHPADFHDWFNPNWGGQRDQYQSSVAMSDLGTAVIAWYGYQIDKQYYAVFMSHYY